MKHILFSLALVLFFFSCKKEKPVPATTNAKQQSFTAVVDGGAPITFTQSSAVISFGKIMIRATTLDGKLISISLDHDTVGTYLFSTAQRNGHVEYKPTPYCDCSTIYGGPDSYAVITEVDVVNKTISGTFNVEIFMGTAVAVTGEFKNIPYTGRVKSNLKTNCFLTAVGENHELIASTISFDTSVPSRLKVTAASDITFAVILSMPSTITPGTYDIEPTGDTTAIYIPLPFGPPRSPLSGHSGQLTIDRHDQVNKVIEGSFNFTTTIYSPGNDWNFYVDHGKFYLEY